MSDVPVIDLQESADNPQELKMKRLREACEDWGCFRVTNHGIDSNLMSEMKKVVRSLLDLPVEIKMRNTEQVIAGSGYMAPSAVNPLYEALGLYDMASSHAVLSFCSRLDASPHQTKVIEAYGKAIHELLMDISKKMAESLGLKGVEYFKGWPCQFRINKYSFTPESIGSTGVQIHTDSSFLTILQDDENVGGLQVMNKSGSFVDVPPCPGTLFAVLGDIAHVWSNGRFGTVKHRVECKEASVRISIASFLLGPKEGDIEAPEELVDSDHHPRLFLPFSYEHYRKLRVSQKMHAGEALALLRVSTCASSD
ncbi:2-oxoglutarate-dependent dioxygenase DAO-like [Neltuma alba]|uniref:2-oxoglutarate-dependent dioxygenase DAO-like n=1 Tax=Neltuma alba TaxID=207710 RepID=UPI0010A57707|nr:2-oxoglutarate-dependent dioxygenase DAO-like [Prosopis alba]XP_028806059.1 2-oxoglutarate-dependent dioxygenase DAO-like [Prosopis alba]XP_028806065.1 2-oxoglutarate-dependent dioxygenase DAO-like [Prosopis alba]